MKNIDRLAKKILKNGTNSTLIHTIPGTANWLICEKDKDGLWYLTVANPMGNVFYNIGTVNDSQHLALWESLVNVRIETAISQLRMVKQLKTEVEYFLKRNTTKIKKLLKINQKTNEKKATKENVQIANRRTNKSTN